MNEHGDSNIPSNLTIDHESRTNSYPPEQQNVREENEDTPLLRRFPQNLQPDRHMSTYVIIGLLLLILIIGVIIGIYLLILQSKSENVLPPVEEPLNIVTRTQWDKTSQSFVSLTQLKANYVSVIPTNTRNCNDLQTCANLLNKMQMTTKEKTLPYNFLLSSNGQLYEASGWQSLNDSSANTLVLALIGNFTKYAPTKLQIDEANNFIAVSESLGYLQPHFVVSTNISTFIHQ